MNHMIDKLSDIEHSATAIMDAANTRKKEITKEMAEKTAAFDSQLAADTSAKINDLKMRMEADMKIKLEKQQSGSQNILKKIEEIYHGHHEAFIKELYDAMVER